MKPSLQFTSESLTFLENWPPALSELSIAQVDIPLSRQDIFAIGTNMTDWFEPLAKPRSILLP